MTDTDFGTFDRAFRRLVGAYRLKLKAADLEELVKTYWRVLQDEALEDVLAAGKTVLTSCKKFPLPVDWLAALRSREVTAAARDLRTMSSDEAVAYVRAERLRYEDDSCACLLCQAAGVTHRLLRFVPDFTEDGRDERATNPLRDRIVTVGHWAHGEELDRWYIARDRFYAVFPRALALVAAVREPGQEG